MFRTIAVFVFMLSASLIRAQDDLPYYDTSHMEVQRYVSVSSNEAFVRRGPSLRHRIDWIYTRRHLPLAVLADYEHWRFVRDSEGHSGWIHRVNLSGTRTAVVMRDLQPLFSDASEDSSIRARLEKGVITYLESCTPNWCEVRTPNDYYGWVPKVGIWGSDPGEVLE